MDHIVCSRAVLHKPKVVLAEQFACLDPFQRTTLLNVFYDPPLVPPPIDIFDIPEASLDEPLAMPGVSTRSPNCARNHLTAEQQRALSLADPLKLAAVPMPYISGKQSMLIIGKPGAGKSLLIEKIVAFAQLTGFADDEVACLASTGTAATNIGGGTLHRFAGIRLGRGTPESLLGNIPAYSKPAMIRRWCRVKLLILDECSMVEKSYFDTVSQVVQLVRLMRKNPETPFAGIKMVFVGDFAQLPPITRDVNPYIFHSDAWKQLDPTVWWLLGQHRQDVKGGDTVLYNILDEVLHGHISPAHQRKLEARQMPVDADSSEDITYIVSTRRKAQERNRVALSRCDEATVVRFGATVRKVNKKIYDGPVSAADLPVVSDERVLKTYNASIKDFMSPELLTLAEGVRVRLTANLSVESGLANGRLGSVVSTRDGDVFVRFDEIPGHFSPVVFRVSDDYMFPIQHPQTKRDSPYVYCQRPLVQANAQTIHSVQGKTILGKLMLDMQNLFETQQFYVALSRAKTLAQIYIHGALPTDARLRPAAELTRRGFIVPRPDHVAATYGSLLKKEALQKIEKAFESAKTRATGCVSPVRSVVSAPIPLATTSPFESFTIELSPEKPKSEPRVKIAASDQGSPTAASSPKTRPTSKRKFENTAWTHLRTAKRRRLNK